MIKNTVKITILSLFVLGVTGCTDADWANLGWDSDSSTVVSSTTYVPYYNWHHYHHYYYPHGHVSGPGSRMPRGHVSGPGANMPRGHVSG